MLIMGMHVQIAEIILSVSSAMAEQALAVPVMLVFVAISVLTGVLYLFTRYRLLTKPELLCILCAMLMAAPLMTQGMWHRFIGLLAAPPKTSSFAWIDTYNDKLWPHGPNLIPGGLAHAAADQLTFTGNRPAWQSLEYEKGETAELPVLTNQKRDEVSSVTIKIPLKVNGAAYLAPGEPYLISFLAHPDNLPPESFFFCRMYDDDQKTFTEVINSKEKATVTFVHKQGYLRMGNYGAIVGAKAKEYVRMEIGLSGAGSLAIYDPKLFSVAALENIYTGKRIIAASDFAKLPENERAGLIVRPDNMYSPAGLWFLISGYIPLHAWIQPAIAWSTLVLLLLATTLALNVIMRKQWAENERYPFPLFQIPYALLGHEDESPGHAFVAVWRNPYMWVGLVLAIAFGMFKGWHFFNNSIPSLEVDISLKQYLQDPRFGTMWDTSFTVKGLFVSFAVFMELNVLLSLVVGYFMYKSLGWVGEFTNLKTYTGYPFRYEQTIGSYLAYAALVVFFTRKYLWKVLKLACGRDTESPGRETFTYRTAFLIILACFLGMIGWAAWLGVSRWIILLFFFFLVVIGFVSSKFRAECGFAYGYFTPYNAMLLLSLLGGMAAFGASGVMVCLIASGFITVSVFFFIPGAQLETMEFGRRFRMIPKHVLYACLLGALGGLLIGGWVFLSNAYALGGDNIKTQWSFDQNWFFGTYRSEISAATSGYLRQQAGTKMAGALNPATYGYLYGAVVTAIFTILRQLFAGFWFHPIGFILSSTYYMDTVWGSLLVAWLIRSIVLRLGGAATVRNKLLPFFVGFFVGCIITILIWDIHGLFLRGAGIDRSYGILP
jgi:hypothetical protein